MATQIDWEVYNENFVYAICVLEQHTHYLHFQIAQIMNCVFDKYCLSGRRVESIWNKIKSIRPSWLEEFINKAPSDPVIRECIELLEQRRPVYPLALPTFDEVINGRGVLYLQLDELLGIPEGDLAGFSWVIQ